MVDSFALTDLEPRSFQHLVNMLALKVLGPGQTTFGPGSDGGRDGYFSGEAPYPSPIDRWKGTWYIQSKFHAPHLSSNPQKWLTRQIEAELESFAKPDSQRKWPDNWIVATNIEPSGTPQTGAFDRAKQAVKKHRPKLHFDIWGGRKLLDLLAIHSEVANYFRHFLTPGHVLTALHTALQDSSPQLETLLRYLVVRQFAEHQFTRLEQAGSQADTRPGIHRLFIDLPFKAEEHSVTGMAMDHLLQAASNCHRIERTPPDTADWRLWRRHPSRSRVWFMRGGPGQGKSTVGQYFCQIQRAAIILQDGSLPVTSQISALAAEVRSTAEPRGHWPIVPRIPINIELKEFAQWIGQRENHQPRGVLTFLADRLSVGVEQPVLIPFLRRALGSQGWVVVFDGLDEVPTDVKSSVASEVINFVNDVALDTRCDLFSFCTSRPQGYGGQLSELDAPTVDLVALTPDQALACAKPVLELGRSQSEADQYFQILKSAMESSSVRELMTSPLQSHIMAVVVRDGGRPPERRWQLFTNFYQVIKRREANRDLPDRRLARLLREETQLLKSVHNRVGFMLQARAETSAGAQTHISRTEFRQLLRSTVAQMVDDDEDSTVSVLMEATTDRLVLLSTPDDGDHLRFDIRPLQEFFAAEFLYDAVETNILRERLTTLASDAHWREVMHFVLSALAENNRLTELAVAVDVLEHINDGLDDEPSPVARSLGRGALLAARLLKEGVLEQDKRMRQQFRHCLAPVGSFVDAQSLSTFPEIRGPNSRSWLISYALETLRERDKAEGIGAAVILTHLLPDGDARCSKALELFQGAPTAFIGAALALASSHSLVQGRNKVGGPLVPREWLARIVFDTLSRPDWKDLGVLGLRACFEHLGGAEDRILEVSSQSAWTSKQAQLLTYVLQVPLRGDTEDRDYRIARVSYPSVDWTTGVFEPPRWLADSDESEFPGFLQLLFRVLCFAADMNFSTFSAILDSVGRDNRHLLAALPPKVECLLPHTGFDAATIPISEGQFSEMMRPVEQGTQMVRYRPIRSLTMGESSDLEDWQNLVNDSPAAAAWVWSVGFADPFEHSGRPRGRARPRMLGSTRAIESFVEALMSSHDVLVTFPGLWGELVRILPTREPELRAAFRSASHLRPLGEDTWFPLFVPLRLRLDEEKALLPHMIAGLVCYLRDAITSQATLPPTIPRNVMKLVQLHVKEMVRDATELEAVATLKSARPSEAAAAAILRVLHPRSSTQPPWHLISDTYRTDLGSWFAKGLRLCLQMHASEGDGGSRVFLDSMLQQMRHDYFNRLDIQTEITKWREVSNAPVTEGSLTDKWLTS